MANLTRRCGTGATESFVKLPVALPCFLAALAHASSASAVPVFVDEEQGVAVNVGVLIQPTVQVTAPGKAGSASAGVGAPDGSSPSYDFFVRRTRFLAWGTLSRNVSYYVATDQPNLGKGGELSGSMFIQDALLTVHVGRALDVDTGMLILPFARHTIESAGSVHTLDFHTDALRLAVSKAFRDVGVQVRGLLFDDRLHYRMGLFEGVRAGAVPSVPATVPGEPAVRPTALNDSGVPRVSAHLRVNIMGVEPDLAFKGISFAPKPLISVGVGTDWQANAVYKSDGRPGAYLALSADVFVDYPLSVDDEIVFKLAAFHYASGSTAPPGGSPIAGSTLLPRGANAWVIEGGVRHAVVEPLAFVEYVQGGAGSTRIVSPHLGLNLWVNKHVFNIKADVGWRFTDVASAPQRQDITATTQAQLLF